MNRKIVFLVAAILLYLPTVTLAQTLGLDSTKLDVVNPADADVGGITDLIANIANIIIGIIAAVSVFYIIWGAIQWMNGKADEGQKTVVNAVIGLIVAILAFFIVRFAVGTGGFLNKALSSGNNNNTTSVNRPISQAECGSMSHVHWNGSCVCDTDYSNGGSVAQMRARGGCY